MTKQKLFNKLKDKGIFWSFSKNITLEEVGDELFIEYLLKYGDFDDLLLVFKLYDKSYIKDVWEKRLRDDKRFIRLNLMLARLFFKMDVEASYFICHRKSEDLDFFTYADSFDKKEIFSFIQRFKPKEKIRDFFQKKLDNMVI